VHRPRRQGTPNKKAVPGNADRARARQAVQAVKRVREESELRKLWDEAADDPHGEWLTEVDDLLARLERSNVGSPAGD
jgi:hypothetical protein